MRGCNTTACQGKHYAKGLCQPCYTRSWKAKAYNLPRQPFEVERDWTDCSYDTAHKRVKAYRGLAKLYVCACGKRARDWAYDHSLDEYTITGVHRNVTTGKTRTATYSSNPYRYIPMCKKCHVAFDLGKEDLRMAA